MAFPATKKRRLSSPSGRDRNITYSQATAGDSFLYSANIESNNVQGHEPLRSLPTIKEAERSGTTPWDSGIYHSNMFKLKTNELLARVQPDYERRVVDAENSIRKLKDTIERIPNREAMPVWTTAFVST